MRILVLILVLHITCAQIKIPTTITHNTAFTKLMLQVTNYTLSSCDVIFIPGDDVRGSDEEFMFIKLLQSKPYIYGPPPPNFYVVYQSNLETCYLTVVWTKTAKEMFHKVRLLNTLHLLNPDHYYVFYSEEDLHLVTDDWSLVAALPKALTLTSKQPASIFTILPSNMFYSRTRLEVYGTWFGGKLDESVFRNEYSTFKGKTLNVTLLSYFPFVTIHTNTAGHKTYSGSDVTLLENVAKKLNFKVRYSSPDDGEFGVIDAKTGNWTGLIAEVMSGRADIGMGGIAISYLRSTVVDFSTGYSQDCVTFITPQAEEVPKFMVLYIAYGWRVWVGILVSLCLAVLILRQIAVARGNKFYRKISNAIFTIGRLIFQVSLTHDPYAVSIRLFLGLLWVFTIIVTVAYRSTLTSLLSVPMFYKPINTVHELVESDLTPNMINYGGSWIAMLRTSRDPDFNNIYNNMKFINSIPAAAKRVKDSRNTAVMDSFTTLNILMVTDYTDPHTGLTTLNLMKECFGAYSVAWIISQNAPYKGALDNVISRFVETGSLAKWYNDLLLDKKFEARRKQIEAGDMSTTSNKKPLTLYHLSGAFLVFTCGLVIALISFTLEFLFYHRQKIHRYFQ